MQGGGGAGRRLPPKVNWQCALFIEEPFKRAFFENIKTEIVNIQ